MKCPIFKEKVARKYYSLKMRASNYWVRKSLTDFEQREKNLIEEVNSANDNPPLWMFEKKHVYHGGNFHGVTFPLEMDQAKINCDQNEPCLAERQLNYLLNPNLK